MQNQLLIAIGAIVLFTYRVSAAWLIPLGFMIDGYLGAFYDVPVITMALILWFVCTELLRPRLMIQASYE